MLKIISSLLTSPSVLYPSPFSTFASLFLLHLPVLHNFDNNLPPNFLLTFHLIWPISHHSFITLFGFQLRSGETAAIVFRELAEQTKGPLHPGDVPSTVRAMAQLVELLDVQLRNLTPGGKDSAARSLTKVMHPRRGLDDNAKWCEKKKNQKSRDW